MLHGSPSTIVLGNGGIKMAGGRPGKEIGDEEKRFLNSWAEKEKARGMVDMVTFRFGDYVEDLKDADKDKGVQGQSGYWLWGNSAKSAVSAAMSTSTLPKTKLKDPGLVMPQDGCIFPGTGALETHSVRDITTYISELYQHGDETSQRPGVGCKRKKHQKRPKGLFKTSRSSVSGENSPVECPPRKNIPTIKPPAEELGVTLSPTGPKLKLPVEENSEGSSEQRGRVAVEDPSKSRSSSSTNAKILNLLTFGWSGGSTKDIQVENTTTASSPEPEPTPPPMTNIEPMAEQADKAVDPSPGERGGNDDNIKNKRARFVIGFLGDLYADDLDDDLGGGNSGGRITSRTVWAERRKKPEGDACDKDPAVLGGQGPGKRRNSEAPTIKQTSLNLEEFRIVIYAVSTHNRLGSCLDTDGPAEPSLHLRFHLRDIRSSINIPGFLSDTPSPTRPAARTVIEDCKFRRLRRQGP